MTQAAGCPS